MLGFGKKADSIPTISCMLSKSELSLVSIASTGQIEFLENHTIPISTDEQIKATLSQLVDKHDLYGAYCQVILPPSNYQLLLMDAPDVPENEMAKALRWQLKGLIDYPLNDVIADAFTVPPHGTGGRRKKVFTAVTLHSALINTINLFHSCFLNPSSVTIAELALSENVTLSSYATDTPCVVVSFHDELCQIHMLYNRALYFQRTISIASNVTDEHFEGYNELLLEIQRSIDYCLMELKLPEPKTIVFTPIFYKATQLIEFLKGELNKEVLILDSKAINYPSLHSDEFASTFYALGGALMSLHNEQ